LENAQREKLIGAAAIVMSSMIISRITGFLRSAMIPNSMSKMNSDALFAAFKMTDLMYNLLIGGAIAAALTPVLSSYIVKKNEEEGWKAVGTFINVIFICMIFVSILGVIFAPVVINLTAPWLNPETKTLAVKLARILFPSVSFIMLAGLANGVLYSYKRFAAAAYGPSIYNMGTVLSLIFLRKFGVETVVIGIACSAFIYLLFQLSSARKSMGYYRFRIHLKHPGYIRLMKLAIPSLAASSITQIDAVISQVYTSHFRPGSITAFSNANDTWQLPFGIFAMGLGTAILPTMSEKLALGEIDSFKAIMSKGIKTVLLLVIPSGAAFIVLRREVISAIFKWSSHYDLSRIIQSSNILMFFSIALLSASILAIVNRTFYANNDTKTPLFIGASTIFINAVLCYVFFKTTSLESAGMSLAYSISSLFNMIVLVLILNKKMKGINLSNLIKHALKVFAAALIMAVILFFMRGLIHVDSLRVFSLKSKIIELMVLGFEITIGVGVYFGIVLLMRLEEAVFAYKTVSSRLVSYCGKIKKIM